MFKKEQLETMAQFSVPLIHEHNHKDKVFVKFSGYSDPIEAMLWYSAPNRVFLFHNDGNHDGSTPSGVSKYDYGYEYSWVFNPDDPLIEDVEFMFPYIEPCERLLSMRLIGTMLSKRDIPVVAKQLLSDAVYPHKEGIRNIDVRIEEGKIVVSYLPSNRECTLSDRGKWKRDGRQAIKAGKLARKIYKDKFTNKDYEEFNNFVVATFKSMIMDLVVVKGEDIRKNYHEDTYLFDQAGTMGNSCMRYDECQRYLDIYVENPDRCSMLVARKLGKNVGRAILWETDDGTKIMDRIYGNDITVNVFKEWARNNGYYHKKEQSFSNDTEFIDPETGAVVQLEKNITLKTDFEYYPYMDTFKYISHGHISNNSYEYDLGLADNTSGELSDRMYECEVCGEMLDEDELVTTSGGIRACTSCAVYCDQTGEYELEEDTVYSQITGEILLADSSVQSDYSGKYYPDSYDVYVEGYGHVYEGELDNVGAVYCEERDIYCLQDDAVLCEECGAYCYKEDAHEHNGKFYCSECYENLNLKEE